VKLRRAINSFKRLLAAKDYRGIINRINLVVYTWLDSGILRDVVRPFLVRSPKRAQLSLAKIEGLNPKISVIVPNYNHAPYLKARLDSVYNQTYKNLEVILLDDCSMDDSRTILNEYQTKYSAITKTVFNEKNAGSQTRQWAKGLSHCTGSLVWIAESDDFCDLNFLETLISYFSDESVQIAYCRTVFVDALVQTIWDTEGYLSDLDNRRWKEPYLNSAADEVERFFSRKNLIANASSAVFRRPRNMPLLQQESWLSLRICSDWIFYLHVMRGGTIAYTPRVKNYYRRHQSNISSSTLYAQPFFYREHQNVGEALARIYNISDEAIAGLYKKIKWDWKANCAAKSMAELGWLFDQKAIVDARKSYRPNVAICGFAFSGGGAETFPIRLANSLKRRGHSITFINFDFEMRNDRVRHMLLPDIPVVNLTSANIFTKVAELRAAIESLKIEVINSHHFQIDNLISRHCSDLKVRHVVTMHGHYEMSAEEYLKTNLPQLGKSVSAWIYTADKNLKPFEQLGQFNENKFHKIGNAVEFRSIQHLARSQFGIPESAFVTCLVSRAIQEKGWFEAIEAVNEARRSSGKDIHLILIGEGVVYEQLKGKTPSYIHCLGFRGDVPECFAMSDLGLLPSYFSGESYPLVLLDCLMAGRPIVASDVGEIPKMLSAADGKVAGTVFHLENGKVPVTQLAKIIAEYAADPEFCRSKAEIAKEHARCFDIDLMTEKYESVYSKSLE
jgi:glycosyltransferase involved in cell wall biosynthesis